MKNDVSTIRLIHKVRLLTLCITLSLCGFIYGSNSDTTNYKAQQDSSEQAPSGIARQDINTPPEDPIQRYTLWLTLATIALVVVGGTQAFFLWQSIKSAQRAASAAEGSANAYMDAERGLLLVIGARRMFASDGTHVVMFEIKNIGRGPVIIRGDWLEALYIPDPFVVPELTGVEPIEEEYMALEAGKSIVTWAQEGLQFREPVTIIGTPVGEEHILFHGCIHYESTFGSRYVYGFSLRIVGDDEICKTYQSRNLNFTRPA